MRAIWIREYVICRFFVCLSTLHTLDSLELDRDAHHVVSPPGHYSVFLHSNKLQYL